MLGYLELAASIVLYGLGIVAQSVAARRAEKRPGAGPGLLVRLASDRLYLLGFGGQVGGFVLAFLARASLPLYLVQAGASSAVGLATVIGVLVLGWRVRAVEVAVLVVLALGLVLLATASVPSVAHDLPSGAGPVLVGLLLVTGLLTVRACRLDTVVSPAILGGVAFSVVAITSRTLADEPPAQLLLHPLAWLMVLAAVLGQGAFAVALQRGSATSAVASMDSTTVVLSSILGIAVLGDRIAPGKQWWVVLGLALVVFGVLMLGSASRSAPLARAAQPEGAT